MPTKLRQLKIKSVDMVPQGANQEASINLFKSQEESMEAVGAQKSKLQRFFSAIAKALGIGEIEESFLQEIEKEAKTFGSQAEQVQRHKVGEEIWDYTYALRNSLESILEDDALKDGAERLNLMEQSLLEFQEAMTASLVLWSKGQCVLAKALDQETMERYKAEEIGALEERLSLLKAVDLANDQKDQRVDVSKVEKDKGGTSEMKIDKSKLTEEEQAALGAMIAKAGEEDGETATLDVVKSTCKTKKVDPDAEGAEAGGVGSKKTSAEENAAEMKKALAEIGELKKSLEMKDLELFAKKYEALGKAPEELAKTLYGMKLAGEEVYKGFIGALDDSLALIEKSGVFSEIGKSGRGVAPAGGAVAKINVKAEEIMKADPSLSRVQAIDKAWQQNPDLVYEHDKECEGN